jgi:hypothetical protein
MTAAIAERDRQPILKLLRLGRKSNRQESTMGEEMRLDGTMIPRRVKRMFDQRAEPRLTTPTLAELEWRGGRHEVLVANISTSGAMIEWAQEPHIGEQVRLTLPGEAPVAAAVRWVRDGRIGLHFEALVG